VVDWLPPDFGAVGQYGMIFAREIAQSGRRVCLIGLTSATADTRCEIYPRGGLLCIKRIATLRYNKARYLRRLLWTFTTNLRLIWEVIRDPASSGADILFTGAPPFMLFFAFAAKLLRRGRLIYRITDFYPEVIIVALGWRPLTLCLLERFTWLMRRHVDVFEALGEDQRQVLITNGIAHERITLKRDVCPIPISGQELPSPHPPELAGRKVLLYSGNYGVAHEIDTVVEGLTLHHRNGSGRFALWLNASGTNVGVVEMRLRSAGIPVARTVPVPIEQFAGVLVAADAHLITLRVPFACFVLPSKVYGCISSRRPILFIGPRSSDVHLLCTQARLPTYEQIEPGDASAFSAALERLADANSPA
jgi:hypothetical protein